MIGLNITKAQVRLQTTPGRVEIDTSPAQLQIHSPSPQLHIDQSQCFADKGYKYPARFMADQVADAQSDYMAGLGRVASEGDQLAKIKGASVADIASSHFCQQKTFNMVSLPKQPPEINCEVYPVQLSYQPAQVNTNYIPAIVESNSQPGQVETYLLQKPSLEINWLGNNIDTGA
jgi:hypothetical protein